MPINTVLGPIAAADLGVTSMHEHILSDLGVWAKEPTLPRPEGVGMGPALQGYLRWDALSVPENLILSDPDVAVDELLAVGRAGGAAILELTLNGMGRRIADLPDISRRSGITICVGSGYYVEETHTPAVLNADIDTLTEMLVDELTNGIDGTGILPALLGEIGTSWPITDSEWRVIRAAGRAGALTGTTVYMHLSFRGAGGIDVLAALLEEGMPADRVIIGHLDERFDKGYHREIAQAGAVLGYDTFGSDFYYGSPTFRNPTDFERFAMVEWLIEEGFATQLIIAGDVWTQSNLIQNGGYGYEHLFRRIAPGITRLAGGDESLIHTIMVENPARLLDRPTL
jgi:phosphotriesterase-related protein